MRNLEIKNNDSLAPCGKESQSGLTLLPESGADAPTVLSAVYTDSTPAKNRQADAPQCGRSMIEMLGVLAIIGVLSVGGIAGYSKAVMKYRINKTIEQITLIAGNVRAFFAPQRSYEGAYCDVDCPVVIKAKLLPDEMLSNISEGPMGSRSRADTTNAFGGGFSLYSIDKSSTEQNKAFKMSYEIESDEACIELVSQDWTNANVAAIFVVDGTNRGTYLKTPVTVDNAVKYCADRYIDDVGFYFDIDVNAEPWKTRLK